MIWYTIFENNYDSLKIQHGSESYFSPLQMSTTNFGTNELRQSSKYAQIRCFLNSLYSPFVRQMIQIVNHAKNSRAERKRQQMSQLQVTKKDIMERLEKLPPETLPDLQTFITFLQFKAEKPSDASIERSRQEMWQKALQSTFGMWAGRNDITNDGVTYVQEIRRGHRLNDLLEPVDETD